MGDTLPKEAAEAAPPPYTSIDPAVSNQRIEPLLPANHGGNPLHTSKANDFCTGGSRSNSVASSSPSSSATSVSSIDSNDLQGCTPSSIRSSLYSLRPDLAEKKDLGAAVRQFRDQLKQQSRMTSTADREESKRAYKQEYRELRKEIKRLVKDAVKETKQERKSRRREKKRVRKEEKQVRNSERHAATKG